MEEQVSGERFEDVLKRFAYERDECRTALRVGALWALRAAKEAMPAARHECGSCDLDDLERAEIMGRNKCLSTMDERLSALLAEAEGKTKET
jgi:hypothetical protein